MITIINDIVKLLLLNLYECYNTTYLTTTNKYYSLNFNFLSIFYVVTIFYVKLKEQSLGT